MPATKRQCVGAFPLAAICFIAGAAVSSTSMFSGRSQTMRRQFLCGCYTPDPDRFRRLSARGGRPGLALGSLFRYFANN